MGHYAVQMAKSFGAYVIGTGSSSKRDFVLKLGADEFIDYTVEKFEYLPRAHQQIETGKTVGKIVVVV